MPVVGFGHQAPTTVVLSHCEDGMWAVTEITQQKVTERMCKDQTLGTVPSEFPDGRG